MTIERKADERENRLPKWAREEMRRLRDAATSADKLVAAAQESAEKARLETKPDEVNTLWVPKYSEEVGLGNDETVRFLLGARKSYWDNIDIKVDRHNPERLEVYAGRAVQVEMNSSNLFHLRLRPFAERWRSAW